MLVAHLGKFFDELGVFEYSIAYHGNIGSIFPNGLNLFWCFNASAYK
jgi:hypothetical protein